MPTPPSEAADDDDLLEALAGAEHASWARWMEYLFSVSERTEDGAYRIPLRSVRHWERQIRTPYRDLTEKEKESDRDEVRRILPIIVRLVGNRVREAGGFGALVNERLDSPQERARPATLRALGPAYRADGLIELAADLSDLLEAHAKPEGAHGRVGDDAVRAAAVAVAVEACQVWLASTGWPEGEARSPPR